MKRWNCRSLEKALKRAISYFLNSQEVKEKARDTADYVLQLLDRKLGEPAAIDAKTIIIDALIKR